MPTQGLSLVGFMDEVNALTHLKTVCVPPDPTDSALRAVWTSAQAQRGAPMLKAGVPDIQPIPAKQAAHIATLVQTPMLAPALQQQLKGATFQMVEIDPLLAYQFTVDVSRSGHHCTGLSNPPDPDELMKICLPTTITPEPMQVHPQGQSLMIKTRCLNLRTAAQGYFPQPNGPAVAGLFVGLTLPLVHVVRFNGQCYLHNGFHRAVGVRLAGGTHIPCIFRDVADESSVGIRDDGSTFTSAILTGKDPPTVGHYTNGRACDVQLRAHSRIVHVSWAEYIAYDE